jgi:hypothetical protein
LAALGALDQALDEVAVFHHVELEPERVAVGVLGDVFERADAHGRQRERNAEGLGRARAQDLAVGVLHAGEAGGRDGHGHGRFLAGHGGAQRAAFHVHGHALAQLDLLEVAFVGAVGAFGPRAGVGVVVEHLGHAALGDHPQVFDAGDLGKVGHGCLLAGFLWEGGGEPAIIGRRPRAASEKSGPGS